MAVHSHASRAWTSFGVVSMALAVLVPTSGTTNSHCSQAPTGIELPKGFCSTVFADDLGFARHISTTPAGDVFVILDKVRSQPPTGAIIALRDTDSDGVADRREGFGPTAGDDIEWRDGYLYYSTASHVARYALALGELVPAAEPEVVVGPFVRFETPEHDSKPFVLTGESDLFLHIGAPSNSCQRENRRAASAGVNPCPLLENTAGIWRFDAKKLLQLPRDGKRVATGVRHTLGLSVHPRSGTLFAVMHGRDLLHLNWPEVFSEKENADLPSDELLEITDNPDYGWPYCYHDPKRSTRVLAPEYGGNGERVGDCSRYRLPALAIPAHSAPSDLMFYDGRMFPPHYRHGAFVAFHGGWGRAPLEQRGYSVAFLPFDDAFKPAGSIEPFATGFAGVTPIREPRYARFRPVGLAIGPDGALFVADSKVGRVWRITYSEL